MRHESQPPGIFRLNTDSLEWRLRTSQISHDPVKDAIQNALPASCTLLVRSHGKVWTGSGFHIGHGVIATAAHVAPAELKKEGFEIFATFDAQNLLPVSDILASEENYDAALLYCKHAEKVPVVELGDSDKLEVGDIIAVVGSPEGWHDTATVGRVSNVHQKLGMFAPTPAWNDIIFYDADILQGVSGGMLIGIDGKAYGSIMGVTGMHADIGIGENAACPSNKIRLLAQSVGLRV